MIIPHYNMKTVYALCDITHVSLYPWRDDGYNCVAIDIYPHIGGDGVTHICQDIRTINRESLFNEHGEPHFIVSFPPCTHFANSGARWWAQKGQAAIIEGMSIVNACDYIIGDYNGLMENPKGRLSSLYRRHDASVQPWQFADRSSISDWYTKETWLWKFGNAKLPVPMSAEKARLYHELYGEFDTKRIHHAHGSMDRSVTPKGFAKAVWEANNVASYTPHSQPPTVRPSSRNPWPTLPY